MMRSSRSAIETLECLPRVKRALALSKNLPLARRPPTSTIRRSNVAFPMLAACLSLMACVDSVLTPSGDPVESGPGQPAAPNEPVIAFVSTRDGTSAIYVADADGSNVARLTEGHSPAWSRDGRRIAFARSGGIFIINADGSGLRFLAEGYGPSWSPQDRIAFHSFIWDPEGGIYSIGADGSAPRLLLPHSWADPFNWVPGYGTEAVQFPVWSPDGQKIAFWLYGGYEGTKSIGIMSADGSGPHDHLSDQPFMVFDRVVWSPDGTRFLTSNSISIMTFPAAGTGPSQLVYGETERFADRPDWSPDGRRVIFAEGGRAPNTKRRIRVIDLETGVVSQKIPDAVNPRNPMYDDMEPAWSRSVAPEVE